MNTYSIKYLLKLPNIPMWSKEKTAKFSYLKFKEYIEKTKALNNLPDASTILQQYFIYDQLFAISKPILFLGIASSIKTVLSKNHTIKRKLLFPSLILIPTGMLSMAFYSLKQILNVTFIKKELLKSESKQELDEYIKFSNYYSTI